MLDVAPSHTTIHVRKTGVLHDLIAAKVLAHPLQVVVTGRCTSRKLVVGTTGLSRPGSRIGAAHLD